MLGNLLSGLLARLGRTTTTSTRPSPPAPAPTASPSALAVGGIAPTPVDAPATVPDFSPPLQAVAETTPAPTATSPVAAGGELAAPPEAVAADHAETPAPGVDAADAGVSEAAEAAFAADSSPAAAAGAGPGALVAEAAVGARGVSVERPEDLARAYALAAQKAFSLAYFAGRLADPAAPAGADPAPAQAEAKAA